MKKPLIALVLALACGASPAAEPNKHEEPAPQTLPPLIVSASRIPQNPGDVTSTVTVLDPEELQNSGIINLVDALKTSPGVVSTSTAGQNGAIGSLFLRGTNTAYSQIVVDGMRISDSSTPMGNFLGNSRINDIGRIEILRGPQGSIHGGESVGGVVWMETRAGTTNQTTVTGEAGSFNSYFGQTTHQGVQGKTSHFLSFSAESTDNDGPNQEFTRIAPTLRIDHETESGWVVTGTYRGTDSRLETGTGGTVDHLDAHLVTLQAIGKINPGWTSQFHAGFHTEAYDSDAAWGNFGTDYEAFQISTHQHVEVTDELTIRTGGYAQTGSYENTIGTSIEPNQYGAYLVAEWSPKALEDLTLHQSVRWEHYDSFGNEPTWRSGAAWRLTEATTLRAGVGSSFRTPTYMDRFGSTFAVGNPNLEAETATGWDAGISHCFDNHSIELTVFQNRIENRIQSFPAPAVNNAGEETTQGVEAGLTGNFLDGRMRYRAAWTWTDEALSDQPENAASAAIEFDATEKTTVGIGGYHFSDHSWGGNPIEGYTILRAHVSHQVTDSLRIHARVENALDKEYTVSDFFGNTIPGAGVGFFIGASFSW